MIEAKGKDKRGNGTAGATVTATFADEGARLHPGRRADRPRDHRQAGAVRPRASSRTSPTSCSSSSSTCLQDKVGAGAAEPAESAEASGRREARGGGAAARPPEAGRRRRDADAAGARRRRRSAPPAPRSPASRPAAAASADRRCRRNDDALDLGATVLPILAQDLRAAGGDRAGRPGHRLPAGPPARLTAARRTSVSVHAWTGALAASAPAVSGSGRRAGRRRCRSSRTPRSGPGRRARGGCRARAGRGRRRPGTAASGRTPRAGRPARPGRSGRRRTALPSSHCDAHHRRVVTEASRADTEAGFGRARSPRGRATRGPARSSVRRSGGRRMSRCPL